MGTTRPNGSLYTKIEGTIATVEFGHPAGNSFVLELLNRLTSEFQKLSDAPNITLIVLKSEGDEGPFCGGASFDELMAVSTRAEGNVFFSGFANLINAMRQCEKLIVGRVQGKTVGGGVGLIAACDYVFATDAAAIRLSELSIGIAPLVIAPAVERKIGTAALSEMSLAPTEWKNAYWAQQKGLFSKVFESLKEMDKELAFFTEKLAAYNPEALAEWKKVLWKGTDHWENLLLTRAELSGKLVLSEFTKKALATFKK
ncbi:enoyl-CoA hydratase/isomerase family protein [Arenibacter sp. GZD96]|uniref:enoyl-CoA hydratase/isomerase family protein n=1 Tax=Aurantibrevibacter litoralis TaxID=3106030 RepID=UPI002B01DCB8|nr:enoyl-CoA hydratase/isomerase family protein [Arenibacter sp. GZD-96]MEA1787262.1 enoyl-CoA hydratase/isomerase family protein [Arenibacter sp. GZD-96]